MDAVHVEFKFEGDQEEDSRIVRGEEIKQVEAQVEDRPNVVGNLENIVNGSNVIHRDFENLEGDSLEEEKKNIHIEQDEVELPQKKTISSNKFCVEILAEIRREPEFVLSLIKEHIKSGGFAFGWLPRTITAETIKKSIILSKMKTKNIRAKKKFKNHFVSTSLRVLKMRDLKTFLDEESYTFNSDFVNPIFIPKTVDEFKDLSLSLFKNFKEKASTILNKLKEDQPKKDPAAFLKAISLTMELNLKIEVLKVTDFTSLTHLFLEMKDDPLFYKGFVDKYMGSTILAPQPLVNSVAHQMQSIGGELPAEPLVDGVSPQETSISNTLPPAQPVEVALSQERADGAPVARSDFRIVRRAIGLGGLEDFCSLLGIKSDTIKRLRRKLGKEERMILTGGKDTPVFKTKVELENYYEELYKDKK